MQFATFVILTIKRHVKSIPHVILYSNNFLLNVSLETASFYTLLAEYFNIKDLASEANQSMGYYPVHLKICTRVFAFCCRNFSLMKKKYAA